MPEIAELSVGEKSAVQEHSESLTSPETPAAAFREFASKVIGAKKAETKDEQPRPGIPVVNKDVASTLEDIDTAKKNQDYMLNLIGKKLASGAPTRLWYGPANTIEKIAQ